MHELLQERWNELIFSSINFLCRLTGGLLIILKIKQMFYWVHWSQTIGGFCRWKRNVPWICLMNNWTMCRVRWVTQAQATAWTLWLNQDKHWAGHQPGLHDWIKTWSLITFHHETYWCWKYYYVYCVNVRIKICWWSKKGEVFQKITLPFGHRPNHLFTTYTPPHPHAPTQPHPIWASWSFFPERQKQCFSAFYRTK